MNAGRQLGRIQLVACVGLSQLQVNAASNWLDWSAGNAQSYPKHRWIYLILPEATTDVTENLLPNTFFLETSGAERVSRWWKKKLVAG